MNYEALTADIIDANHYMALATVGLSNDPWIAPVAYVHDVLANFYFVSNDSALHSQNIAINPLVAFSIFNSCQLVGSGTGIQATGIASHIDGDDIDPLLRKHLHELLSFPVLASAHHYYKITPDRIFLPDAERWSDESHPRTSIDIAKLFR